MPLTPTDDARSPLATFEISKAPRAGEEVAIRSPVVTIGRRSQNDVVLDDDSVSATHARLEYETGGWRLTDLGSANGTFIGETRLSPNTPAGLDYGASVRFGGVAVQFRGVDAADLEEARARYIPTPETTSSARRPRSARFPVWLFVLILIILGVVIFLVVRSPASPTSGATPAPVPTSTPATPAGDP